MKEEKRNEVDEKRFDHHLSRASFLEPFKKEKEREVKVSHLFWNPSRRKRKGKLR